MNNETMSVEEKTEAAHIQSAYEETRLNGTAINWRNWVEQMPTLSAAQAACLMSALDPDKFTTMSERPGKNDPSKYIEKARIIQRTAKAQGRLKASPMEWVDWAKTQRINVHIGFLLAVWELPADVSSEGDIEEGGAGGTATESSPAILENWKMQVQAEAARRWKEQRKLGCNPTLNSLKDELSKWCRETRVVTTSNITPSPEYLYRHVLSAKHWTPPTDD